MSMVTLEGGLVGMLPWPVTVSSRGMIGGYEGSPHETCLAGRHDCLDSVVFWLYSPRDQACGVGQGTLLSCSCPEAPA